MENKKSDSDIKFYCQFCGRDLTSLGGLLSEDGKILCTRSCIKIFVDNYSKNYDLSECIDSFKRPKEITDEIEKGKLTQYTLLKKFL